MTLKLETLPGDLAVTEGEKHFISALKKEKVKTLTWDYLREYLLLDCVGSVLIS
jgi:hypothetical protein